MAAVVVAFRLIVRPPRGVSSQDPPGVRTVAVFSGDDAEWFAGDRPDSPLVGVRLFHALCDGLARAGIRVENRGTVENAQCAECAVDDSRFCLVLEWIDRRWMASVEWTARKAAERRHLAMTGHVFSPPDSPALRRLLECIDRWLHSQPKLHDVGWHRKECWLEEDLSDAHAAPVDRPAF